MKIWLDFETWSAVNIRRGSDIYMDHAKPLVLCYAVDDGPVETIDYTDQPVMKLPLQFFFPDAELWAHNVAFDRLVVTRLFNTEIPIERWHCSQALALSCSLPGGLGPLCEVLGVPVESAKQEDGKRLIRKFCGPKDLIKDAEWPLFLEYARHDILAMRECVKRCPQWNYQGHEKRVWDVDQTINNRGFMVDTLFASNAVEALKAEKKRLNQQTFELTDSTVGAATQRDKLLLYLCEQQGLVLKDLRGPTIEEALEDPNLDDGTKELLKVRLQSAKASPSKYQRVLDCVGAGDRLRGTLQYSGANRTARWAGRMFQPQNLLRPTMDKNDIRACIDLIRSGHADAVPMFAPLNTACANGARGIIVAPEGKVLQGADYSAIEGRGNAWVAGEEWKLKAFAEGRDMYKEIYSRSFSIPVESVDKQQRQVGKVCLSGESLVLSDSGWKRLDSIQLSDKVWDGEKWAIHEGLVCNGLKNVVNLFGLWLTPDHQVWCGTMWQQASCLVDSKENMISALVSGAANLSSLVSSSAPRTDSEVLSLSVTAAGPNTWWSRVISTRAFPLGVMSALRRLQAESDGSSSQPQCRMLNTEGDYSVDLLLQSLDAIAQQQNSGQHTAAEALVSLLFGAPIGLLFSHTFKRYQVGTIHLLKWIVETSMVITSLETFDLLASQKTTETDEKCEISNRKSLVYDLLSVGDKNRFLVLTAAGPLLVHNCELALGFEGGVGAFVNMASAYNMDLNELGETVKPTAQAFENYEYALSQNRDYGLPPKVWMACETLKLGYRKANPAIAASWKNYKAAAIAAIRNPGKKFHVRLLTFDASSNWLRIQLPSGRYLCYALPAIHADERISYMAWRNRRWVRTSTYGGKLCENIVQAISRDILAAALVRLHDASYDLVLHVHDEAVAEVDAGRPLDEFVRLMTVVPEWAAGFPIAAEGFEVQRYEKA